MQKTLKARAENLGANKTADQMDCFSYPHKIGKYSFRRVAFPGKRAKKKLLYLGKQSWKNTVLREEEMRQEREGKR